MRGLPLLAALAIVLLASACAGDDSNGSDAPLHASDPQVAPGLRSLGSGTVDVPLDPGQVRDLDPINMTLNLGLTPPACADFVLVFTWQVRLPQPPGEARVHFTGQRMGGAFDVGGPNAAGQASVGCALLQATNESSVPVVVEMRFVVASSRR